MQKSKFKSYQNAITEGPILSRLLLFFFPIVLGTFFQQLYNTSDAIIVGNLVGKRALGAVGGTTGTIINLLVGFFVGLSSGATVIISQYFGARDDEQVKKSVHTSFALAICGGIVLMILGIYLSPKMLTSMNTPDDIYPLSLQYIRIYFLGIIPNLVYNIASGILRAIGDTKRPLYFLIVSCFINIVLDLLFVGTFHMGVAGAAIATIISQYVSAVLVIITLLRTKASYGLVPKNIRFSTPILKRIINIGLPAGLQSVMYSISNVIIQSHINSFGTDTVAAWTAYGKIDGLFWMVIGALGISVTTFIGQNYGAKKTDRVHKCVKIGLVLAFGISILFSIILYFLGQYIYRLFTDDETVLIIGMKILHFLAPAFFTYICIEVLAAALRGIGDSLVPMIITCLGVCVLRIVWLYTAVPISPSIITVIFSYPLTWVITSILFILYYSFFSNLGFRKRIMFE